jgi:outer membrane protein assembly factor BamE (lipoprotein component of BamABCDE complex)
MLTASLCQAERIIIPVGNQSSQQSGLQLPQKGMTQADVIASFGEPQARKPASGEPPISRWTYPDFSVYFESDVVIHSVVTHQPAAEAEPAPND